MVCGVYALSELGLGNDKYVRIVFDSRMNRKAWIDQLRGIAIVGVVVGHSMDIYWDYLQPTVWQHMAFTIPWFVFLSGMANSLSARNKPIYSLTSYVSYIGKRSTLLIPYTIASVIAYTVFHSFIIDVHEFIDQYLIFFVQPTFYFINLILQLYLVFPLLYNVWVRLRIQRQRAALAVLLFFVSFVILPLWNAPWPFSPTGSLFGGGYLFIFFLGIVYANSQAVRQKPMRILIFLLFLFVESIFVFTGSKPSGFFTNVFLAIWSLLFLLFAQMGVTIVEKVFPLRIVGYFGRYSLMIYLYHYIILQLFRRYWPLSFSLYLVGIAVSILLPLLCGMFFRVVSRRIQRKQPVLAFD